MHSLEFDEQISPTAARPIGVPELLKRLKTLCKELESLDQETVERESLTNVAQQLVSNNVLQHKNKGVTAFASCCIADLLRLCAPDAPYSQKQLKAIFECFVKQLKGLGDPDSPYYPQYFYLLESLATVESVVLLGDIDKSDSIIVDLFQSFFDVVQVEHNRTSTDDYMIRIMSQLIDEIGQLPQDVLAVLLSQVNVPHDKKRHAFIGDESASKMATAVFRKCADRLQTSVCQYFIDIMFEASDEKERHGSRKNEEQLSNAHKLIITLFTVAPTTLQNVIPHLETELSAEDIDYRKLATETISAMLACTTGSLLIQQYPNTYKAWAGRRNDKSVTIRSAWVEGIGLLINSDLGAIQLVDVERLCIDGLLIRLVDPDDKVRSTACSIIERTPYDIVKRRFTFDLLETFYKRCRDKKHSTQEAAFKHVGRLFDWAYSDIAAEDKNALDKFSPIVDHILQCIYVNDQNLNILIERTLHEDLLKCSDMNDDTRTRRLLSVVHLANERSRHAFFAIVGKMQIHYATYLDHLMKCCEAYKGGQHEATNGPLHDRLTALIKALVHKLPHPESAENGLLLLAKSNDRRLYKLLEGCVDPANDYRTIQKKIREAVKGAQKISAQSGKIMEIILRRSSFQIFNRSIVLPLNQVVVGDQGAMAVTARFVLSEMAKSHPTLYKAHVVPMTAQMTKDPHSATVESIKALAQFAQSYPADVPDDEGFRDSLQSLMQTGSPQQAKYAVCVICNLPNGPSGLTTVVNAILNNLIYGSDHFLTELATIAETSLLVPDCIEDRSRQITEFCAKELLMKNRRERNPDDTDQWTEEPNDECIAKCLAIRILGNRLRAYHAASTAVELAMPVFRALRSIIVNMGELSREELTPHPTRSRLRLEAAKMFLKLALLNVYEKLISPSDFIQIALFAQDLEYNVRKIFLSRLFKYLLARKMTPRWHAIIFLAAHDPDEEIRNDTRTRAASIAAHHSKLVVAFVGP